MASFYKFETTPERIKMVCGVQFTPEEALQYITDFKNEAAKVNPASCLLDLLILHLYKNSSRMLPKCRPLALWQHKIWRIIVYAQR